MSLPRAGRHVVFAARPGDGDALSALLVEVGTALGGTRGCDSWVVSRVVDQPERVVVDERWSDRETMDAAAAAAAQDERLPRVRALLSAEHPPVVTELEPVGGAGLLPHPRPGVTHASLLDAEDQASAFGLGDAGEARFPGPDLGLERCGLGHYRIPPGARQPFGHRHAEAEELYVVLAGSGRVRTDDEVRPLAVRDAVRVGPEVTRAFEAGPDGLELLAVGASRPGDGELLMGWWSGD